MDDDLGVEPLSPLHGEFGDILRELRRRRGVKQSFVAPTLEVSEPTYSRWENGKALPPQSDLPKLATILRLDDAALHILEAAWHRGVIADTELPDGLHLPGRGLTHVKTRLDHSIEVTRQLRSHGQPQLAYRIATSDADEAHAIMEVHAWSESESPAALELLTELYLEIIKCALDYFTRRDVRKGALDQTIAAQATVAAANQGAYSRLLSLLALEGVEWLRDNRSVAHEIGLELLSEAADIPELWRPEVLRANAINAGAVQDHDSLVEAEAAILDWRGTGPAAADEAFVLEGLARGAGQFDLESGLLVLREGWSLRENSDPSPDHSPLRFVQLARTEGLLHEVHRVPFDTETERRLSDALDLSTANGYERYTGVLEQMLA